MPTLSEQRAHHALPEHELVLLMETHASEGLSSQEAAARLDRLGANVLPPPRRRGLVLRVLAHFHHPLVYVLMVAAALTVALQEWIEAAVIAAVVLVNVVVGFLQEERAEKALEALMTMTRTQATVLRGGERHRVDSTEIVPGDVCSLQAGDKVPADLRLVSARDLAHRRVRTHRRVGAGRQACAHPAARDEPLADRANLAFAGSLVVSGGRGSGVVIATGDDTELGRIYRAGRRGRRHADPADATKLAAFSKLLTVVILALAARTFAASASSAARRPPICSSPRSPSPSGRSPRACRPR